MEKTKKTLFIAHYFTSEDRDEKDWMIFIAPENCDRVKEFKHVYKCEMGEAFPQYMELDGIYDIPSAFDYRDKGQGEYEIKLIKDSKTLLINKIYAK